MAESRKFTFEVPADLRAEMDAHPEINWSAVFREAIRRQVAAAEIARQILEEQEDPRVKAVAEMVRAGVARRWRETLAKHGKGR